MVLSATLVSWMHTFLSIFSNGGIRSHVRRVKEPVIDVNYAFVARRRDPPPVFGGIKSPQITSMGGVRSPRRQLVRSHFPQPNLIGHVTVLHTGRHQLCAISVERQAVNSLEILGVGVWHGCDNLGRVRAGIGQIPNEDDIVITTRRKACVIARKGERDKSFSWTFGAISVGARLRVAHKRSIKSSGFHSACGMKDMKDLAKELDPHRSYKQPSGRRERFRAPQGHAVVLASGQLRARIGEDDL